MEIDDDYESFSFPNNEPSPSPKHRRLKRLKKTKDVAEQSAPVESISELLDLPRVDFASIEALESSNIRAFDDSSEPLSSPLAEGFDGDGDGKELSPACADTLANGDRKKAKRLLDFEEGVDDANVKEKDLNSCYDDTRVNSDRKETIRDLEFEESFGDDGLEKKLSSGAGDTPLRTDRNETKRALEFEDEITESVVDKMVGKEAEMSTAVGETHVITDRKETKRSLDFDDEITEHGVDPMVGTEAEATNMKIREDGEKEVNEDPLNEKGGKKKRLKSSSEDPKVKAPSKRREAKERRANLEQLHAESQRLLRETRGASFKPVPVVHKPISSVLEKIRQRKLEVSKKFSQLNSDDSVKEDDDCLKQDKSPSKIVETEVGDLSDHVKEDKVSSGSKEEPESDEISTDGPDVCEEQKGHDDDSSQMDLDDKSTPVLRAPVDDTQELFGDSQTSDSTESKDEETDEHIVSSQEEEMQPSLLTMKLKFDSVPDDMSDEEEENDKENVAPHMKESSSPKGAPAKAFLDDEAEEEDDSDNDRMRFGDDEESDEDDDDDDIEELREMIATGYEEKPVDKETRDELHQKWLEEKDAAGTDDLLRRLNVASKLREGSLLDGDGDGDHDQEGEDDVEEDEERPRVPRLDPKKAKELIAQMFLDKDEGFVSSDDEETEKILAKERLLNKAEEKGKLVSPDEDEDSREVFGLIKKLNVAPEARKKAKTISYFDTMLTGGNSNSSSKSSFLSRASTHSLPSLSKQGSSGGRSFIFGRDDSNSRSSMSVSEDTLDTTTTEIQTKKVTTKYNKSSTTTKLFIGNSNSNSKSNSSTSLFEMLKRSSVQTNIGNKESSVVELSQSVFASFKIPKKPIKIQGRV